MTQDQQQLTPQQPYESLQHKLAQLRQQHQMQLVSTHQLVFDALRVLNDVCILSASLFLHVPSVDALMQANPQDSPRVVLEMLRDAELLTPQQNEWIVELQRLAQWLLVSASRHASNEKAMRLFNSVVALCDQFADEHERARTGQLVPVQMHLRSSNDVKYDSKHTVILGPTPPAHLPSGWSIDDLVAHCVPLYNTALLDLEHTEEEAEEKHKSLVEERKAKIQARRQLEKQRKLLEKRFKRQEERKQRRAAVQEERARLVEAGELTEEEAAEQQAKQDEEEAAAAAADAESAAAEGADDPNAPVDESQLAPLPPFEVPPPVPPRQTFSFCCIACHQTLLAGKEVERVAQNLVWSKAELKLKSVSKSDADLWLSRPCERVPKPSNDSEDGVEPEADDSDEEGGGGSDGGSGDGGGGAFGANGINQPDPVASSKTVYSSIAVHCTGCHSYVGRYIPAQQQYRLIYIQRSSGRNVMYFTGKVTPELIPPFVVKAASEGEGEGEGEDEGEGEGEGEGEEEDGAEDGDATEKTKKSKKPPPPIPAVVGTPTTYVSVQQAELYPFPRFGAASPYSPDRFHPFASIDHVDGTAANGSNSSASLAAKPGISGAPSAGSSTTSTSAPTIIGAATSPVDGVTRLSLVDKKAKGVGIGSALPFLSTKETLTALRRHPDADYTLKADSVQVAEFDVRSLLLSDREFYERRVMDTVSTHAYQLFHRFPTPAYANAVASPIPAFTHFFVSPPEFTHARGTARYLFHFLTGKDDSKVKRFKYSYSKLSDALLKLENAVCHLTVGGFSGHRVVVVKVGRTYRVLQSNHNLEREHDRFTLIDWLSSYTPWSRILSQREFHAWLVRFEVARRGDKALWEELFCMKKPLESVNDAPQDSFKPEDVQFAVAKLLDFALHK